MALTALGEDANAAGAAIRALIADIEAQAAAAARAARFPVRSAAAQNRRGDVSRSGGETQAEVNARFAGASFGLSTGPRSVQGTFNDLTPSQRNQVRQQARDAGVTNAQDFTRFVVQNSPNLDRGGLSFDLGGQVRVDQIARLQAGETVFTRAQSSALRGLLSGIGSTRACSSRPTRRSWAPRPNRVSVRLGTSETTRL